MGLSRRFDMRVTTRAELTRKLDEYDRMAALSLGAPVSKTISWENLHCVVATWSRHPNPQTSNEPKMTVTGAALLGDQFRTQLADIKKKLAGTQERMTGAMGDLRNAAANADKLVKDIQTETADLNASLGLHSNLPPGEGV